MPPEPPSDEQELIDAWEEHYVLSIAASGSLKPKRTLALLSGLAAKRARLHRLPPRSITPVPSLTSGGGEPTPGKDPSWPSASEPKHPLPELALDANGEIADLELRRAIEEDNEAVAARRARKSRSSPDAD